MDEIAEEFKKELQSLLDRYKNRLSPSTIMCIAQPIFKKTIGFRDKPELHNLSKEHLQQILDSGPSFMENYAIKGEFRCID